MRPYALLLAALLLAGASAAGENWADLKTVAECWCTCRGKQQRAARARQPHNLFPHLHRKLPLVGFWGGRPSMTKYPLCSALLPCPYLFLASPSSRVQLRCRHLHRPRLQVPLHRRARRPGAL